MEATQSFRVDRNLWIPMRDGVRLASDIWQPLTDRAGPVILFRTPYTKEFSNFEFFSPLHAVKAGFTAVVQDCRGRFASEGEWQPFSWSQEGRDGYDAIEWIAAQPWCDGAIGMAGPSYMAVIQYLAALERPPHLKAIAPAIAGDGKLEDGETGATLFQDHLIGWLSFMALDWMMRKQASGTVFSEADWQTVRRAVTEPGALTRVHPPADCPLFDLTGYGVTIDRLRSQSALPPLPLGQIKVPMLFTGGWFDMYLRGTLGAYAQAAAGSRGDEARLIVGPWAHAQATALAQGDVNFGLAASGGGMRVADAHVAFFRRHLMGVSEEKPPAVSYFLMQANTWREAPAWPPPKVRAHRYEIGATSRGAARLDETPTDQNGAVEFELDLADPTPTCGGRNLAFSDLRTGPIDQRRNLERGDILAMFTDGLDADVDIIGRVRCSLHVSSDASDADFICKLVDRGPDGTVLPLTDGVVRLSRRRGRGESTPYRPDEVVDIDVDLAATAWRVKAGHAIGLLVQGASFPHIDLNVPADRDCETRRKVRSRVHFGPSFPSALHLTIMPGDEASVQQDRP